MHVCKCSRRYNGYKPITLNRRLGISIEVSFCKQFFWENISEMGGMFALTMDCTAMAGLRVVGLRRLG